MTLEENDPVYDKWRIFSLLKHTHNNLDLLMKYIFLVTKLEINELEVEISIKIHLQCFSLKNNMMQ